MEAKAFEDSKAASTQQDVLSEPSGFFHTYIAKWQARTHRGREITLDIAMGVLGFLFGRTSVVFGGIPLGIGLFCASKKRVIPTLIGLGIGMATLGMAGWVYGLALAVALGLRLLCSQPGQSRKFLPDCRGFLQELPELRIAVACLVGLMISGYQLFVGGFNTASLLFSATMTILSPLSCWLFSLCLDHLPSFEVMWGIEPFEKGSKLNSLSWKVGGLALLAGGCFSLANTSLFGLSIGISLCVLATLYVARRMGALYGLLTGGICGLVLTPLYAPSFALLGMIVGVLWPVGSFFALGLGVAAGTVWASFIGGLAGFLATFPEICIITVLFWPVLVQMNRGKTASPDTTAPKTPEQYSQLLSTHSEAETSRAMLALSGALESLTKLYVAYKESTKVPDKEKYMSLCEMACTPHCQGCKAYVSCREDEKGPGQAFLAQATDRLSRHEPLDDSFIPDDLRRICGNPEALAEDIRIAASQYREDVGTDSPLPALEYDVAAALLREAVKREKALAKEDVKLTAEVAKILRSYGCHVGAVSVKGQKKKKVSIAAFEKRPSPAAMPQLIGEIEQACGCKFGEETASICDGVDISELTAIRKYTTETAVVMRSAKAGDISGDMVRFFDGADDTFCAVLSDGMGTGAGAAAVASLCGGFLEKLLEAGCSKSTAIKILNHLVRQGCSGSGSTLDLAEIDLLHGDAVFLKAGAAPSYIKRGRQIFRIRSKTIPLGLLANPDTEKTRFRLEEGDVLIMTSDGVSQVPEDSPWLTTMLSAEWGEDSLQDVATKILSAAMETGGRADDMTVALIKIKAAG